MPPDNGGYMIAAYVVTAVILVGYVLGMWRRVRRAMRDPEASSSSASRAARAAGAGAPPGR